MIIITATAMLTRPVNFDEDSELMARHGQWAKGKIGFELPLCLHMTAHVAPILENNDLFSYVLSHARPADAQVFHTS